MGSPKIHRVSAKKAGRRLGVSWLRLIIVVSLLLLQSSCATRLYNIRDEKPAPEIERRILAPVNQAPRDLAGRVLLKSRIGGYFGKGRPPLILTDGGEETTVSGRKWVTYSAGLIPSKVEAKRQFRLVNRLPGARNVSDYEVLYFKRTSVWERFKVFHRDEDVLARGLAWAYVNDRRK
jgi:hypothetical protein